MLRFFLFLLPALLYPADTSLRGFPAKYSIEEVEALMPTPTKRKLELVAPARFTATLEEPIISGDKSTLDEGQLPSYTAHLVYVNYGVPADYEYLKSSLSGLRRQPQ